MKVLYQGPDDVRHELESNLIIIEFTPQEFFKLNSTTFQADNGNYRWIFSAVEERK